MRFIVQRTSGNQILPDEFADVRFETIFYERDLPIKAWVLETEDLMDLIKLRDESRSDIVLGFSSSDIGLPVLSIFDKSPEQISDGQLLILVRFLTNPASVDTKMMLTDERGTQFEDVPYDINFTLQGGWQIKILGLPEHFMPGKSKVTLKYQTPFGYCLNLFEWDLDISDVG